jgi:DNA gyrase/topoisomerase IV subunit A
MGRAATGVGGMDLADGDQLLGTEILSPSATVLTVTANGRATQGVRLMELGEGQALVAMARLADEGAGEGNA